jgi:polyisoprenoid-binding protein YceI
MNLQFFAAGAMTALLAVSSLTSPAIAQQVASRDPASVRTGTYRLEPLHTQIGFTLSHFGFSHYSGMFSGATGTLSLDPDHLTISKLEISVPVQSIQTTVPALTDELKGDQWFDAARFPAATFISTSITKTGVDTATIAGDLTLHGVTRPVTLQAHLVGSGTNPLDKAFTVGFEATGVIERSDFGIKQYLPLLGDDVALQIDAAFVLKS